jgi:hypothetical protein
VIKIAANLLALDGRAVSARSAMTEWVMAETCAATHSGRCATTSPNKGEEDIGA